MSKIIGVTVGTTLPKPNFKQTDPTKGDYIRNKPDFEGLERNVSDLTDLVGPEKVSVQIENALVDINKIYSQNDEPVDAPEGSLWVDTDEESSFSEFEPIDLDATLTQEGQAADAKAVGDALAQKQPIGDYALKSELPTDYLTEIPEEYVTETELNAKGYLTEHQSLEGLATESYVNTQIAAIPTPDVSGQINTHNTATNSHNDIRLLIEGLTTRLNALADSDDTTLDQMSEIVAYIKSNKNLIDSITTNKVNVSDIINNLTTNVSNKPLSAAQGVALKALIDAISVPTKLSQLTNDSGFITGYTETDPTVPAWAKAANKPTYTASEVGADASGTANSVVSTHNTSASAHSDIRGLIGEKVYAQNDEPTDAPEGSAWIDLDEESSGGGGSGKNGKDGISATHSWNGTTLTITSASGTSSADLKGEKGDKGDTGSAGYSPVRGTDYWTAADKAEIKSYVDEAILGGAW